MPQISILFFKTAIVFLIVGIAVGLHMSISGDHSPMGAHAHVNLLGWVTSALFGVYYALVPAKSGLRLAQIQYWIHTIGVAVLGVSLYFMLRGNPSIEPIVAVSSLVVFGGVLLFAYILFSEA